MDAKLLVIVIFILVELSPSSMMSTPAMTAVATTSSATTAHSNMTTIPMATNVSVTGVLVTTQAISPESTVGVTAMPMNTTSQIQMSTPLDHKTPSPKQDMNTTVGLNTTLPMHKINTTGNPNTVSPAPNMTTTVGLNTTSPMQTNLSTVSPAPNMTTTVGLNTTFPTETNASTVSPAPNMTTTVGLNTTFPTQTPTMGRTTDATLSKTAPVDTTTTSNPPMVVALVFSSNEIFTHSLSNQSSSDFKKRVSNTKQQIEPIYREFSGFTELVVLGFRNGSIVTNSQLHFDRDRFHATAKDLKNALKEAVAQNKINFSVIIDSISVTATVTSEASGPVMNALTLFGMILVLIQLMEVQSS